MSIDKNINNLLEIIAGLKDEIKGLKDEANNRNKEPKRCSCCGEMLEGCWHSIYYLNFCDGECVDLWEKRANKLKKRG